MPRCLAHICFAYVISLRRTVWALWNAGDVLLDFFDRPPLRSEPRMTHFRKCKLIVLLTIDAQYMAADNSEGPMLRNYWEKIVWHF